MRITSIAFAALAVLSSWAQGRNQTGPVVRVKAQSAIASSPAIVEPAKALASQLFSRIGVELRWEKRPWTPLTNAGSPEEAVVLEMLICSSTQRGVGRFSA